SGIVGLAGMLQLVDAELKSPLVVGLLGGLGRRGFLGGLLAGQGNRGRRRLLGRLGGGPLRRRDRRWRLGFSGQREPRFRRRLLAWQRQPRLFGGLLLLALLLFVRLLRLCGLGLRRARQSERIIVGRRRGQGEQRGYQSQEQSTQEHGGDLL